VTVEATADMGQPYYKSQERRTEQVTARVPKRIKDSLQRLAYWWTSIEREETGDADIEVTIGDVLVRLADVALEGAWEEAREKYDEKTIDARVAAVERSLAKKTKSNN
jgi:hypothetical protein